MLIASQFTDEAVAWSSVVLAIFTVVLVFFNLFLVRATRSALDQAKLDTQEGN